MSSSASSTLTPLFARMSAGEWRLARFLRDHIVLVEGLIGSGKSTLTTRLTRYVRERLCLHAVEMQEDMRPLLLGYFFGSGRAAAITTQMTMLCKRVMLMRQATAEAEAARHRGGAVVFMDRSLAGDRAFARMHAAAGTITPEEAVVYEDEASGMLASARVQTPLVALLLDVDEATLKRRIAARGRHGEATFYLETDPAYLTRLRAAYDATLTVEQVGCPVVAVPWGDDACELALTDADCERLLTRVADAIQV